MTLVTAHVGPQGGVRISTVTPQGEEIVVPDLEQRMLASKLWYSVMRQEVEGHKGVFLELERLVEHLAVQQRKVEDLLKRVEKATNALEIAVASLKPVAEARTKPPIRAR